MGKGDDFAVILFSVPLNQRSFGYGHAIRLCRLLPLLLTLRHATDQYMLVWRDYYIRIENHSSLPYLSEKMT